MKQINKHIVVKQLNTYIIEKLKINKDSKISDNDKLDEIAYNIVSYYFGGYIPKSLSDEGMKCTYTEELYLLVAKIEELYCDEHPEWEPKNVDDIHKKITELVRKLNK